MALTDALALEGKVAVVTGGGGNIGRATVRMLAEAGTHVVVADFNTDAAQESAETASKLGVEAISLHADATRESDIAAIVDAAVAKWGRIDIGVNIVGGGGGTTSVLDTSDTDWQRIVEWNLYSTVRCCRAFARVMKAQGNGGSLINIASPAGLRASPGMGAYGAAQAAVINVTWTLAVELAADDIRVNVVVPAFVMHPGLNFGGSAEQQAALAKKVVPMGRVTRAEDVAGAIMCFASNLTSYSTGQMIVCDGGRLLTNPIFA
jgi:3-oxoacyl-[acyl-carrier protein] reductase